MKWWEKEELFETKYRNGTICENPDKYVPKKLRNHVEIDVDSDGYWVYLYDGYHCDTDRIIHVYTITDMIACLKVVSKFA